MKHIAIKNIFIFLLLFFTSVPLEARQKIGLVLGGGGARGAAHIGVLQILKKYRIPVDYIAGTSMGAIVGGLFASGMPVDEIEEILTGLDWYGLFDDSPVRRDMPYRLKMDDNILLRSSEIGYGKGGFNAPKGLIEGINLNVLLKWHTLKVSSAKDFSHLPVPFKAIAVDLASADPVVLSSGNLAQAIRASMAIPGVFSPVKIGDKYLVDGGVLENLPVDTVKDMGADIVIAVDVAIPLEPVEKMNSPLKVLEQSNTIVSMQLNRMQVSRLSDKDIYICPALEDIGPFDFLEIQTAIDSGMLAAESLSGSLLKYSMTEDEYQAHRAAQTAGQPGADDQFVPEFIRIDNSSHVPEQTIRDNIKTSVGKPLQLEVISEDISRIYSMGDYERVEFFPAHENGSRGIVIKTEGRSWGPVYFKIGHELEDSFDKSSRAVLRIGYNKTRINPLGARWKNILQIGSAQGLFSEYYQPLTYSRQYFVSADLDARHYTDNIYTGSGGMERYLVKTITAGMDIGAEIGPHAGMLKAGLFTEIGRKEAADPAEEAAVFDIKGGGYRVKAAVDSLDDIFFPGKGMLFKADLKMVRSELGSDGPYDKLTLKYMRPVSMGKNTLLLGLRVKSAYGSALPLHERYWLGGFMNLSGYRSEYAGSKNTFVAALVYYRLLRKFFGPLFRSVYTGCSLESGLGFGEWSDFSPEDMLTSGSVFLGIDTGIGPMYIAYGFSFSGNDNAYVTLGKSFW